MQQLQTTHRMCSYTPEEQLPAMGAEEMVMSGVSCSVYQNSTALKTPSAVKERSRLLRPLSSGGQRILKCQASMGSVRGRYMPSARGAPAAVQHFRVPNHLLQGTLGFVRKPCPVHLLLRGQASAGSVKTKCMPSARVASHGLPGSAVGPTMQEHSTAKATNNSP